MERLVTLLFAFLAAFPCNSQSELVKGENTFAFRIYQATKPDSSNFFISPFGLSIALAIANEGAGSATREELDRLLSIAKIGSKRSSSYRALLSKTTELNDSTFKSCKNLYGDTAGTNELFLSNSIWINDAANIDEQYKKVIQDSYYSNVFSFNSTNMSSTNERLDSWVSNSTNNKITHIDGLDPLAMMGIFNAIYFMGEWDMPFDIKQTKRKKFHTIRSDKIDIDYLRKQSVYRYYENEIIQAISLPYKCEQFSMLVILPKKRYGILDTENQLNQDYLGNIVNSARSSEVILSLPKFRIETEISPKDDLHRMGFTHMFSNKADFTGISSSDSLKISKIIQKTFIELDEKKTEAAAVTKIEIVVTGYAGGEPSPPPPPKIFNADHPFVFFIIDNRTGAILFSGRFVKE